MERVLGSLGRPTTLSMYLASSATDSCHIHVVCVYVRERMYVYYVYT